MESPSIVLHLTFLYEKGEPGALHFSHTEWLHCLVMVLQVCSDVVGFYVGPGIGTQVCLLV